MSSTFKAIRAVLMRLSRRDPAQLVLIITALLFGCVMLVGWSVRTINILTLPSAPPTWSTIQTLAYPTATPANRDQRICDLLLTLYPIGNGQWYDVCPFHDALYVSVLAADHTLLHGPSDLDEPYPKCDPNVLGSRDLVLLCKDNSTLGSGPAPLRLHIVDQLGRPHIPVTISGQTDYCALAIDPSGGLHVAWLDPQPDRIWTVHFASYSGDVTVLDSGASLPPDRVIGVIYLAPDHMLLNFALGADAHTVYVIWDDSSGPYGPGSDYPGIVYALTFPLDKPMDVQQVTLAENMQNRSPPLVINDHTLALALVKVSNNNAPSVAYLVNGKTARIDTFTEPLAALYSGPYLSLQADGSLQVQWSIWAATQGTITYASTTRSFP